ncbi:phospholipase D-like domain-containing protein [Methylocystis rosea]|nr:phospholipase D-like domain-containing protein [Methylocystis rosea]
MTSAAISPSAPAQSTGAQRPDRYQTPKVILMARNYKGSMAWFRAILAAVAIATLIRIPPTNADPVETHYAPGENLERVDAALIKSAHLKIDLTAFSLTDWPIIDALIDAHWRGVRVRILLDPTQRHAIERLREIAGSVRMKAPGPYMHLKSYSIDGLVLRSGSANLTASGLKQQDNDLVVIREAAAARAFEARFEQIWSAARPITQEDHALAPPALQNAPAGGNCRIKGNINRKGERIYHLPGERDYARTRMDKGKGERWFCSQEEAVAAGWRKVETR